MMGESYRPIESALVHAPAPTTSCTFHLPKITQKCNHHAELDSGIIFISDTMTDVIRVPAPHGILAT